MWETELGRGRVVQLPQPFQFGSFLRQNLGREGPGGAVGSSWRSGASQPSPFVPCPQLEVNLEEIPGEGLLVSWAFTDRPDLRLTVLPKLQNREVRGQGWERSDRAGRRRRSWGASPPCSPPRREVRSK